MDRPFEHIDLGEGTWVDIYTVVTRGMRKKFRNAATTGAVGRLHINGDTDLSNENAVKALLLANLAAFDLEAVDDSYLLHGIKAWSWPDQVTLEIIDAMPAAVIAKILERMQVLYSEVPQEEQKKDIGTSSQLI